MAAKSEEFTETGAELYAEAGSELGARARLACW